MEYTEARVIIDEAVEVAIQDFKPFKRSFLDTVYDSFASWRDPARRDRIVAISGLVGARGEKFKPSPEFGDVKRLPAEWQKLAYRSYLNSLVSWRMLKEMSKRER